jgi:uncharacterized repeat protein (TIGR02543 family)
LLSFILVAGGTLFAYGDGGDRFAYPHLDSGAGVYSGLTDEAIIEDLTRPPVNGAEYDGYIVKMADGASTDAELRRMKKFADDTIGDEIAVVDRPEEALKFADAEDIEVIEPNYKLTSFDFPQTDPVDPYYIDPRNHQWGIRYVNAASAWKAGYRGNGVNIAIMDTGIVSGHEDLYSDKILYQYDWVSGDTNAEDDNMHGSMVGGIIAADINNYVPGTANGVGMAGITDQSHLFIHKVLDSRGDGSVSDILYAYNEILESGERIDVINLSLGHEGYLKLEDEIIQKVIDKGIIVVAATGNNGADTDGTANAINYPAGYANVIGVGSVGMNGSVSDFSTKNKSVDVMAPGEFMVGLRYGTRNGYLVNTWERGGLHGTSFAAPVVAAAAVIAKQRDKSIDSGAFLTSLARSSRDAGPSGYDTSYGNGILDIDRLVNYLNTGVIRVTFNANGGQVGTGNKNVWPGGKYGSLPTPTRAKYGFLGWYTNKTGGTKVTSLSTVGSSPLTLYAHWQGGTTLGDLTVGKAKLSPAFSYKKTSYKLTLSKSQASVKITPVKVYKGAKMQIKVGSDKYKTKNSVTVKLNKGKKTTVYVKLSKKGIKTRIYKINIKRKK